MPYPPALVAHAVVTATADQPEAIQISANRGDRRGRRRRWRYCGKGRDRGCGRGDVGLVLSRHRLARARHHRRMRRDGRDPGDRPLRKACPRVRIRPASHLGIAAPGSGSRLKRVCPAWQLFQDNGGLPIGHAAAKNRQVLLYFLPWAHCTSSKFWETSDVTRSPAQEAARLLSVHKILEAADLAQQAQDWELTTKLIEIAFAVLDEPSEPNESSSATSRFE